MSHAPATERLRVVFDTNIYISAFQYPKGRVAALWDAAGAGHFHLIVSPAIIQETARVLREDFQWQEAMVERVVRIIAHVARKGLISPQSRIRAITADPDDDRILECAIDGKADLIISNDRHLRDIKKHAGIPIVAAIDFRRTLGLQ